MSKDAPDAQLMSLSAGIVLKEFAERRTAVIASLSAILVTTEMLIDGGRSGYLEGEWLFVRLGIGG